MRLLLSDACLTYVSICRGWKVALPLIIVIERLGHYGSAQLSDTIGRCKAFTGKLLIYVIS